MELDKTIADIANTNGGQIEKITCIQQIIESEMYSKLDQSHLDKIFAILFDGETESIFKKISTGELDYDTNILCKILPKILTTYNLTQNDANLIEKSLIGVDMILNPVFLDSIVICSKYCKHIDTIKKIISEKVPREMIPLYRTNICKYNPNPIPNPQNRTIILPIKNNPKNNQPNKGQNELARLCGTADVGTYEKILAFLDDNIDVIPSSQCYLNIIPNSKITWAQAWELYIKFREKGLVPDQALLHDMMRRVVGGHGGYQKQIYEQIILDIEMSAQNKIRFIIASNAGYEILEKILEQNNSHDMGGIQILHDFMRLLTEKNNENFANQLYNLVLKNGLHPDISTLKLACENNYCDLIDKIISTGIEPNMDCLYLICSTKPINLQSLIKILNHKLIPDKHCFKLLLQNYCIDEKVLRVLIMHGFVLDFDCVELSIQYDQTIHNLEDYGIMYDQKLYDLCVKHGKTHLQYVNKIKNIGPEIELDLSLINGADAQNKKIIRHKKTKK